MVEMCAKCGTRGVPVRRVVERFNHADRTTERSNGYAEQVNHHVRSMDYHSGLTRYGQRMLCDECCRLCAGCGHRYVPDANHPHACLGGSVLPYDVSTQRRQPGTSAAL